MTFGHGNFDRFGADMIFAATIDSLASQYPDGFALITKTGDCKYKVRYSDKKEGAKVQNFKTHASAVQYANEYEPTGMIKDDSGGPTIAVDAVISDWSDWSECDDGIKTRTKTIITPASCGGATPEDSELTEDSSCCSDANATENAEGTCECNEGYSMNDDGDCIEDPSTDTTTDTTTGTTVTAQSTDVIVAPTSGMSGVTKGLLAVLVIGGIVISQR